MKAVVELDTIASLPSARHGDGVFAQVDLPAFHTLVIGGIHSYSLPPNTENVKCGYHLNCLYDLTPDLGAIINHSFTPNTEFLWRGGLLHFYTLRAISKGTELTVDYGPDYLWPPGTNIIP